jgi:anti-anti-sigma factor
MDITKFVAGDVLEVKIKGRLDAYWADHLSVALDETVRDGAHRIHLNMADVTYMSSVGIRVLLKFYKQLQQINGSFTVSNPSQAVKAVLELSGLEALLAVEAALAPALQPRASRPFEKNGASFEVFEALPNATLTCRAVGDPTLLIGSRFKAEHCRTMKFPAETLAVGLGAFGSSFEDSHARFGEFLAVAGAATYLPTDGSSVPDYLVSAGAFVPEMKVLYAVTCEGTLGRLTRFEAQPEAGSITLAALAQVSLEIAGAEAAGIVIIGETAGLVGAALRRSPATGPSDRGVFEMSEIRERLSFTPERAYRRSLALAVGVATRDAPPELSALLRPLAAGATAAGHFHAAAFSYRPLQKGDIDLAATVATLFEAETLQGILHLLTDDREISGAGQSDFVRGACWIGPIATIVTERT